MHVNITQKMFHPRINVIIILFYIVGSIAGAKYIFPQNSSCESHAKLYHTTGGRPYSPWAISLAG